jgi:hypothetical protein
MSNHALKGGIKGKPWLKILIITIIALTVICGLLWTNAVWGNPIRKHMAKSRCLDYFEEMYNEEFIIIEISYWPKLPGYVLALSPESDPHIQFTCNLNCETLCYSDEYGGALASRLLVAQISEILGPGYGNFDLHITASEDPFTGYGGENPDYFETDPCVRLTKNHQNLSILWVDPSLNRDEFEDIAEDIARLIESQLPVVNPNLQVTIAFYPDETYLVAHHEANYVLFSTFDSDE